MKKYVDEVSLDEKIELLYSQLDALNTAVVACNNKISQTETSLNKSITTAIQNTYPIGSIYISVNATNPQISLGFGTWEQIKDRFLLASGSSYSSGSTGGEASHKLTVNEMPGHDHTQYGVTSGPANSSPIRFSIQNDGNVVIYNNENTALWSTKTSGVATTRTFRQTDINKDGTTSSTGGNSSHNNMPPYLVVNIWRRVA